jgi:hypothetical protein
VLARKLARQNEVIQLLSVGAFRSDCSAQLERIEGVLAALMEART